MALVRTALPDAETVASAAALFGVLSDPSRIRVLASLMVTDELCVTDLAATAGMRESTTSHALRLLRTNRVVTARREGRTIYYSLADEHVRHVLHDVLAHAQHADDN